MVLHHMNPALAAAHFQGPGRESAAALTDLLDDFGSLLDSEWKLLLCLAIILVSTMYGLASTIIVRRPASAKKISVMCIFAEPVPRRRWARTSISAPRHPVPTRALPPTATTDHGESLPRALGLALEPRLQHRELLGRNHLAGGATAVSLAAVAQQIRACRVDK